MTFQLPELPYSYDALEPFIDAKTMEIHHSKHHDTYVENLNKALKGQRELQDWTCEELLFRLEEVPASIRTAIRNNGGGHLNHSLFWTTMKGGGGGQPKGEVADAIKTSFGSFSEFKSKFSKAALAQFGSGWTWLYFHGGELSIESTPNQDNPLTDCIGTPILGLDVWEHAYYLLYQNRRADYVEAWWNVINWEQVLENLTEARKSSRVYPGPVRIAAQSMRNY